jgi:hypothetical protein
MQWRRQPAERIVRWIGASNRKQAAAAQSLAADPASAAPEDPPDNVIALTWEQTFGRPD